MKVTVIYPTDESVPMQRRETYKVREIRFMHTDMPEITDEYLLDGTTLVLGTYSFEALLIEREGGKS